MSTEETQKTSSSASIDTLPKGRRARLFERARRLFLAGMLVIVPVVVTIYAILVIMNVADRVFGNVVEELIRVLFIWPEYDRFADSSYADVARSIISFVLAVLVIMFIGWLSTFFLIRRLIHFGESIVSRVPLVKFFYNTPKEVLQTFAATQKQSFKRVIMIEYPRRGIWCLGFATNELIKQPDNTEMVAIFLPTTPNPTSGFLLLVPREDCYDTNIPVEEGIRLIISGGILAPNSIFHQRFAGLHVQPVLPPLGPLSAETPTTAAEIEAIGQTDPPTATNTKEPN